MDYRYLLYFERDACFDVLERLAEMAAPGSDEPTTLVFPDRRVILPYSGWLATGSRLVWDDPSPTWDFMTVLCFQPDEEIDWYIRGHAPQRDEQGRVPVGYIYLSVHRDMTDWPSGTGEDLVLFEFGTPGSSMSVLFWESKSIQRTFAHLLESCHGVCGLLDMEDSAELRWLRGVERSEQLPTAQMTLADIEHFVGPDTAVTPRLEADDGRPTCAEPSFWTPRNSTCDPRWRQTLDRFLTWWESRRLDDGPGGN